MVPSLDIGAILVGLGGGLALFLYGMRKMTEALKTVAGARLKDVLARIATNRFTGAASGALVTATIQSSSVTTVMVVGFVSAGLLTFTQSVGVIMGANVGTTVTAQIVAFDVAEYALAMIAVGFLTEILARSESVRHYGMALMGLGLLFFGMGLMSDATEPVRDHEPFMRFLQELRNPLLGLAAGFLFTAIVQSSSATTGIVIVLATQGFITLETGIALILGSNVGTCVTAMLSAIGRPREAVKAAVVHVLFNLAGVALFVGFIPAFADLARAVSPAAPELAGTARLAAEVPRQIANAHTIFNVGCTVLFIGFAGLFAAAAERIVPARRRPKLDAAQQPLYLDPLYLDQPAVALDRVKLELDRLAGLAREMAEDALPASLAADAAALRSLRERDQAIDDLHGEIVAYLGRLSAGNLVDPLPLRLQEYFAIANALEGIGDAVADGFVALGEKRAGGEVHFNTEAVALLEGLAESANGAFAQAVTAFRERDGAAARAVVDSKRTFNDLADSAREALVMPVSRATVAGVAEYRLGIEFVDEVNHLHALARRVARAFLDAHRRMGVPDGVESDSRSARRE
ncbi:MAG: Na/Pi cotransporter family protein [bacterium]|nr:Na/Pi cotransporter family protein [bacterium]